MWADNINPLLNFKLVKDCIQFLNLLCSENLVRQCNTLMWFSAHCGIEGNVTPDTLTKVEAIVRCSLVLNQLLLFPLISKHKGKQFVKKLTLYK